MSLLSRRRAGRSAGRAGRPSGARRAGAGPGDGWGASPARAGAVVPRQRASRTGRRPRPARPGGPRPAARGARPKLEDIDGNPLRDLNEYRVEWNQSFQFDFVDPADLTESERSVLALATPVLKLVREEAKRVREVLVSQTMRIDAHDDNEAAASGMRNRNGSSSSVISWNAPSSSWAPCFMKWPTPTVARRMSTKNSSVH